MGKPDEGKGALEGPKIQERLVVFITKDFSLSLTATAGPVWQALASGSPLGHNEENCSDWSLFNRWLWVCGQRSEFRVCITDFFLELYTCFRTHVGARGWASVEWTVWVHIYGFSVTLAQSGNVWSWNIATPQESIARLMASTPIILSMEPTFIWK